jgi:DtxR family Mn-dependent transcriptional regulator
MPDVPKTLLSALKEGDICRVTAVKDTATPFLQYLEKLNITIGSKLNVVEVIDFDGSMNISIEGAPARNVSMKFADSLFVSR